MKKTWLYFFTTQFLGVFNDNILKNLICFIAVLWVPAEQRANVIAAASALMVLPFILFSPFAGKLALKYPKTKVFQIAKLLEIPIMLLACVGFALDSLIVVLIAMLLMGLQSALYSPSKYGLIREFSQEKGVAGKLGIMELLSFNAVLIGALVAGWIADLQEHQYTMIVLITMFVALLGYWTSKSLKSSSVSNEIDHSSVNPFKFFKEERLITKKFKGVNNAIFGLGAFWFIASLLQMNILIHCPAVFNLSNTQTGLLTAMVAIGIGAGCFVSGKINAKKIEMGRVFSAAIGLGIFTCVLGIDGISQGAFTLSLILAAFFAGMYKIPLNAWIQERTDKKDLGNVLAFSNMVVFISILLAALVFGILENLISTKGIFVLAGILALLTGLVVLLVIPVPVLRMVVLNIAKLIYRFRFEGLENIPKKSGAILICNHVSMLDALVILSTVPRNVRFVMHDAVYQHKILHRLFKKCNMIPVKSGKSKEALSEFTQLVKKEVESGHIVCIFPEGQLSRTGQLMEFKKGIEYLSKAVVVPILPMHMDNLQGTPLSFKTGSNKKYGFSIKTLRKKVYVQVGALVQSPKSSFELRQIIKELEVKNVAKRFKNKNGLDAANTIVNSLVSQKSDVIVLDEINWNNLIFSVPNYSIKDLMGREQIYIGTKDNRKGKPIPGVTVQVLNSEQQICAPMEVGYLYFKHAFDDTILWIETKIQGFVDESGFVQY